MLARDQNKKTNILPLRQSVKKPKEFCLWYVFLISVYCKEKDADNQKMCSLDKYVYEIGRIVLILW